MRRKGEKPVLKYLDQWHSKHPVAHMIETGSHWFGAWVFQKNTPIFRLSKASGLRPERISAISAGDDISRAELDALARAWSISAGDLEKSINSACKIVD